MGHRDVEQPEICSHCQLQAMTLRACGKMLGVNGLQYALAFFDTARADGLTLDQMVGLLRALDTVQRAPVDSVIASAVQHITTPHPYYGEH